MPVNHKKINPKRGQKALDQLRAEMKKTADAIREEEEFGAAADGGATATADRFPAVKAGARTPHQAQPLEFREAQ
ncbi:hypothetical protein [Micromonospora sp. NPDC093244]|uniref:hypothetical protein n=1 Tax=Micromonospora sp. NPDC093244 TaxID=3155071 RepID=UPI00342BBE84